MGGGGRGAFRKMVFRVRGASGWRRGSALGVPCGGVTRGWGGEWDTGNIHSKQQKALVEKSDSVLKVKESQTRGSLD